MSQYTNPPPGSKRLPLVPSNGLFVAMDGGRAVAGFTPNAVSRLADEGRVSGCALMDAAVYAEALDMLTAFERNETMYCKTFKELNDTSPRFRRLERLRSLIRSLEGISLDSDHPLAFVGSVSLDSREAT